MEDKVAWFEALYDRYADAIFRHLYARLGDRERAKELMQDVFLKTWEYVEGGNTITHEQAFLYKIAHRTFINEIRTDKQHRSLDTVLEAGFDPPDTRETSEQRALERELKDRLGQLKESYRTVLTMRYLDDLPVKTIAEILEENETNISMRISRALEALKATYQKPYDTNT